MDHQGDRVEMLCFVKDDIFIMIIMVSVIILLKWFIFQPLKQMLTGLEQSTKKGRNITPKKWVILSLYKTI